MDSANSAFIFVSHVDNVDIRDFYSYNNKNITVINVNDLQNLVIYRYSCYSEESNFE